MNVPIPKLAMIGVVVLLIGFSPEILATVNIDTVPPNIEYVWPSGTSQSMASPLTLGKTETLILESRDSDININTVTCLVWPSVLAPEDFISVGLSTGPESVGVFKGNYTITHDCLHHFMFTIWDRAGNKSTMITYGEVGDADGDFYLKDGNDASYTLVTKESTITFNHNTIYFKFVPTSHAEAITRVYIYIKDVETFDLTKQADGTWNGTSRTLSDGTYTINGYFVGYGKTFLNLSILVGSNVEPEYPTAWSTYDWLKILGGALIVVGFIWKK